MRSSSSKKVTADDREMIQVRKQRSVEKLSSGSEDEEDSLDELNIERGKTESYELWRYKGGLVDDLIYSIQDEPDSTLTKVKNYFGFI